MNPNRGGREGWVGDDVAGKISENTPSIKLVISTLYCNVSRTGSEAVEFDRGLGDALFSEEVGDLEALIALELDDLAKFFVVN